MIGNIFEFSSDYVKKELNHEYLSLEEESGSNETNENEQDLIDLKDEDELETKSTLSHTPSSCSNKSFDRSQREPTDLPVDPSANPPATNSPADLTAEENHHNAVARAKNIIAFFRALYNEQYFRNIDPNYFAVISDGKLIGICENEEIARQVAAQTNINIGDQIGDGMVFPISGNFKSKRNEHIDLPI